MNRTDPHPRAARRAFTLLELLVVMGILLVLATLTVISVGKVTRDAKLANATNTVVSALGTARAIAIRDNAYVMVTFRVAPDRRAKALPREPQVIQVVTARWTGEVVDSNTPLPNPNPTGAERMPVNEETGNPDTSADRFIPVAGVPARDLPSGILVAGPAFGFVTDDVTGANDRQWRTQPRFAGVVNLSVSPPTFASDLTKTEIGWAIGVLFGPNGRVLSRNPEQVLELETASSASQTNQNAYVKAWVDYDGNGFPRRGTTLYFGSANTNVNYFVYDEPTDEPLVDYVPYLAVFNDAEARERFNAATWRGTSIGNSGNPPPRIRDQSLFIEEQADRITFNRYTGVPGIISK